jgi:predicted CXXCH cytochrome family protein
MTRKYVVLFLVFFGFFAAANVRAQYSHIVDVKGTDHNLSTSGTGSVHSTTLNQICYFCHTPHQEMNTTDPAVTTPPNAQIPLWNHYLSNVSSYGVYSSPSFDALGTNIADLGATNIAGTARASNLCLSCHDGTVGVNTLYKGVYSATGNTSPAMSCNGTTVAANTPCYMPSGAVFPQNPALGLREDHPINFTYDATLAAKTVDLVTPTYNTTGIGGTRYGVTGSAAGLFLPLFVNNTMQCATCHNVHSNRIGRPFLRDTTTNSALCLDCHGA